MKAQQVCEELRESIQTMVNMSDANIGRFFICFTTLNNLALLAFIN